jgi:hypothetical protein
MAKTVQVKLVEPIVGHRGPIHEVTVKAPGFALYAEHGDPFDWIRIGDDERPHYIENDKAVRAYMRACILPPEDNPLLLDQIGLADAQAVKDALIGFFVEARLARLSPTSPTSSSSTSS